MKYIDLHCDTLMKTSIAKDGKPLFENSIASVDFQRMKKGDYLAQFFAIFLLNDKIYEILGREVIPFDQYIDELLAHLKASVHENNDLIKIGYNGADL